MSRPIGMAPRFLYRLHGWLCSRWTRRGLEGDPSLALRGVRFLMDVGESGLADTVRDRLGAR